jgi:hypothetical protein
MLLYKDKIANENFIISRYEITRSEINTLEVSFFTKDEYEDEYLIHYDEIVMYEDVEKLINELRTNYLNRFKKEG